MPVVRPGNRFFETTRGQIVSALRRGTATVDELARVVGLTDNGVRAHLATLERDGLVRQAGVRRGEGAGKPATLYEIHPDAEPALSRAYAPVLVALLDELAERIPEEQRNAIMSDVGRRLAHAAPAPGSADLEKRVRAAAALLNSLGGETQVERRQGALAIRGCGCPLSAATARRPEVCRAVQTLLTEIIGAPVREQCDRDGRPQCRFEVPSAA
jgi:predicted ArsR family transcriptional regulator